MAKGPSEIPSEIPWQRAMEKLPVFREGGD
jgi:hypothetical protein